MLIYLLSQTGSNKSFIFDHGFNAVPGWDLSVVWLSEEGLPKKGILAFEMFAGDGLNLMGCLVDKKLRNMLTALVLVEQRDLAHEVSLSICEMLFVICIMSNVCTVFICMVNANYVILL